MRDEGREIAREMVDILDRYRQATGNMMNALLRSDDPGIDAALAARWECIAEYSAGIDRWIAMPDAGRDSSFLESIHRHHLCIDTADTDLLDRIESLKSEVGEAIVRVGKAGRMHRSYLPSASEREPIVNGEG